MTQYSAMLGKVGFAVYSEVFQQHFQAEETEKCCGTFAAVTIHFKELKKGSIFAFFQLLQVLYFICSSPFGLKFLSSYLPSFFQNLSNFGVI